MKTKPRTAEKDALFYESDKITFLGHSGKKVILAIERRVKRKERVFLTKVSKKSFGARDQKHLHLLESGMKLRRGNGYFYYPNMPR